MLIGESWIGQDAEGSDGELILDNITALAWRGWGEPRETWVRIAIFQTEFWTRDFPSTKQEYSHSTAMFGLIKSDTEKS
jgi:hypothetical protein